MSPERKLDIVIPSYNRPARLFALLDTGLKLNMEGIHFAVIDDGSYVAERIDTLGLLDTKQVCDYFKSPNIIYIKNPKNMGVARSWARYYEKYCNAKYTMSVNDKDIFIDKRPILSALKKLDADDSLCMVVFPIMQKDRVNELIRVGFSYKRMSNKEFISRFVHDPSLQHCGNYGIKRVESIRKAGVPRNLHLADAGLDDAFGIDIDLLLMMAATGNVDFENEPHLKKITLEGATERYPLTFAYTYYQYAKRTMQDLRNRDLISKEDARHYLSNWLLLILSGLVVACRHVHGTEQENGSDRIGRHLHIPIHIYLATEFVKYRIKPSAEMRELYFLSLSLLREKKILEETREQFPEDIKKLYFLSERLIGKNKISLEEMKGNRPLLIHHIQKTAGTALIHYLEGAFPSENIISRLGHDEESRIQTERVLKMTPEEKDRIQVICGHQAYKFVPHFPYALQGAFFRHPVHRIISQYNFEHEHAEAYEIRRSKRPLLKDVGEKAFLEHVLEMGQENGGHNGNFQARTLAYFLGENPESVSARDLPRHMEKLHFIGIQEHLNLSVFMLHKLCGFPLSVPPPIVNTNPKEYRIDYLPGWFMTKCEEYFHLDFLLYELACKRFDEQYDYVRGSSEHTSFEWMEFQKLSPKLLRR